MCQNEINNIVLLPKQCKNKNNVSNYLMVHLKRVLLSFIFRLFRTNLTSFCFFTFIQASSIGTAVPYFIYSSSNIFEKNKQTGGIDNSVQANFLSHEVSIFRQTQHLILFIRTRILCPLCNCICLIDSASNIIYKDKNSSSSSIVVVEEANFYVNVTSAPLE